MDDDREYDVAATVAENPQAPEGQALAASPHYRDGRHPSDQESYFENILADLFSLSCHGLPNIEQEQTLMRDLPLTSTNL